MLGNWRITRCASGGYNLRVNPRGRGCLITTATLVAAAWIMGMGRGLMTGHAQPYGVPVSLSVAIGIAFAAFAVWVAFADESWRVAPNCLEHHVGIGRIRRVRRYQDAELALTTHWTRFGSPWSRLLVVDAAGRHLLLQRRPDETSALADFICRETGWKRRRAPDIGPGS